MCFCCCDTRKRTLIYAIVISTLAFIFGIFVIIKFGSRTKVYKALIKKIEYLEDKGYSSISDDFWIYYNYYYDDDDEYYDNSKDDLDAASMAKILSIDYSYLKNNSYGLIKRLEGIESFQNILLFTINSNFSQCAIGLDNGQIILIVAKPNLLKCNLKDMKIRKLTQIQGEFHITNLSFLNTKNDNERSKAGINFNET